MRAGLLSRKLASRSGARTPIIPILITLAAVALAGLLGWAMWGELYGSAVDTGRHRARLCRHHGSGGRGAHRRAAGRRQRVRA